MKTQIQTDSVKERNEKIGEIACLMADMNDEQIRNMHTYAVDEYQEPNHEAEALDAIVRLSRKMRAQEQQLTCIQQPDVAGADT